MTGRRSVVTVAPFARNRHGAALVRLMRLHARFERAAPPPDDVLDRTLSALARGDVRIWVAELDGEPVGYLAATTDYSAWQGARFAHMDCLFVLEQHRRHGIGRRLVNHLAAWARTEGISQVQWQTPVWNADATAFYTRLGAAVTDKRRFTLDLGDRDLAARGPRVGSGNHQSDQAISGSCCRGVAGRSGGAGDGSSSRSAG